MYYLSESSSLPDVGNLVIASHPKLAANAEAIVTIGATSCGNVTLINRVWDEKSASATRFGANCHESELYIVRSDDCPKQPHKLNCDKWSGEM